MGDAHRVAFSSAGGALVGLWIGARVAPGLITTQEAANVGTFAVGLGTLLAGAIAFYGLGQWRAQKRAGIRADAAGNALAGVLRFCDAMMYLVSAGGTPYPNKDRADSKGTAFLKMYEARLEFIQPQADGFLEGWRAATAYLDDRADDLLKEVWDFYITCRSFYVGYGDLLDTEGVAPDERKDFYNKVIGPVAKRNLEERRDAAVDYLKPIARHET